MKIGLTGGIGSGKSQVARIFSLLGIPVFNADQAARFLMEHDPALQEAISRRFGKEVYQDGRLNRPFLASVVFADRERLDQLNGLVHPAVIAHGNAWSARQEAPYTLKEAALFYESGSHAEMDRIVGVYAPLALRLQRVMKRDGVTEADVLLRMDKQMNEEEKMERCDHVIRNDESLSVIQQVLSLHHLFTEMAKAEKEHP